MDNQKESSPKRIKLNEEAPAPLSKLANDEVNEGHDSGNTAEQDLEVIKSRIKEKTELLETLRRVEIYRKKWSIDELTDLTKRWKEVAQVAFEDLFQKSSLEKESLTREELLEHLGLDPNLHDDFTNNSTE